MKQLFADICEESPVKLRHGSVVAYMEKKSAFSDQVDCQEDVRSFFGFAASVHPELCALRVAFLQILFLHVRPESS